MGRGASRRRVAKPASEHGPVSVMGASGHYYANTVGASGVVSAGRNWGRLASAFRRWALKLVGAKEVSILLFSDDALFSEEEGEISEESSLVIIFSDDSTITIHRKKIMGKQRISMDRIHTRRQRRKSGIFEVKRRFALEKSQLLPKLENPTANQAQSVEGPLRWVSKMCPWLRPFLAGLRAFFGNRKGFQKSGSKSPSTNCKSGNCFKIAAF